jgi:pimeloyl-ACP methyl ester carboxylesterase
MSRARLNGVELEYEIRGTGEPVLFISPVLADGFVPLLSEADLADRYQMITYHKRGWVGSSPAKAPVTVSDHATDAAALLDHLGVARAHVAGHSSGAAVALQLALDYPAKVHTIALLELSLFSLPSAAALMEKATPALNAYGAGDHAAAIALFLSAVSGIEWERCRALLDQRVPGMVRQSIDDADTFFGVELPALGAWSFGAKQAASISQPVLSVLGTETEPLWVDVAAALRSWLSDVEDCTIEGAGHLLHLQRPGAVAAGIAAFLARHPLPAASQRARHRRGSD